MSDETSGKYRERFEDEPEGGLAREEEFRARAAMHGLAFERLEEESRLDVLEFAPLLDRMSPADELNGLPDDALPDFGIGSLVARQRSERCGELLERARALIAAGQTRPALGVVEQALGSDPASGEALALKVRLLVELRHHEAALRLMARARESIADPELRFQVLRLESVCVRAITRALEERLAKLVEGRQWDEALALVKEGLRRQPSNIVFLHHLANLYWARGEQQLARQTVEEARRHVGRENVDLIAELERKIDFGAHRAAVEAARAALRDGNPSETLSRLETCRELEGNEHYDALRAYAEEKRRGGFGRAAGGGAQRQQTLRWIVAEEMHSADEALRAGDFRRARGWLDAAAKLEPGCLAVSFRRASAIVAQYRQALDKGHRPARDGMREDLRLAGEMLDRVSGEPDYSSSAASLRRAIQALLERVA